MGAVTLISKKLLFLQVIFKSYSKIKKDFMMAVFDILDSKMQSVREEKNGESNRIIWK
jgi:hypothetical protein